MTYKLPARSHLVHKAVEPRNLSKKLQAVDIHDPEQFEWQLKYDGCNMFVVVRNGVATAYSRTGEVVKSVGHILKELERVAARHEYDNIVWFGEAWNPFLPHSRISGLFRQFDPAPDLHFVLFDCVGLDEFESGKCEIPYTERFNHCRAACVQEMQVNPVVHYAHSFRPDRLEETAKLVEGCRQHGPFELDGYVAKRKDGYWVAGAGRGGEVVKVKDHLSLDLKCVGTVQGKGKFAGMIGALQVEYNGQVITVGGGKLTDEERQHYWQNKHLLVDKIVEVHALAGSEHDKLREPRFIRIRDDKTEADA